MGTEDRKSSDNKTRFFQGKDWCSGGVSDKSLQDAATFLQSTGMNETLSNETISASIMLLRLFKMINGGTASSNNHSSLDFFVKNPQGQGEFRFAIYSPSFPHDDEKPGELWSRHLSMSETLLPHLDGNSPADDIIKSGGTAIAKTMGTTEAKSLRINLPPIGRLDISFSEHIFGVY